MNRFILASCVALALCTSACGGSNTPAIVAGDITATTSTSRQEAANLVTELGSEQAALDALIIAMDRGYSAPQILDAVTNLRLNEDGTIDGQDPAAAALGLVLYSSGGEDEGAFGSPLRFEAGDVLLVSFFQVEQTPIDRLRRNATFSLGVGEPGVEQILRLLKAGFTPAEIIEILILGIDGSTDHPEEPDGPTSCLIVVNEIYCAGGERYPVTPEPAAAETETTPPETAPSTETLGMQLRWEGLMTPNPEWVKNPVEGTINLTRSAGTNDFHLSIRTADTKTGTFTTDGFDSVECSSEWSSLFDGTGTFVTNNDLRIEFNGQITRQIVYTDGPCDSVLDPETSDFLGVVALVTEQGIEVDFNAWNVSLPGAPVPISD